MDNSSGSAVVRLQIFAVKGGQAQPIVKKTTGARQLVEVDGFTFIRKRVEPPVPAPQPSPKRPCVAGAAPSPTSRSPLQLVQLADDAGARGSGSSVESVSAPAVTPLASRRASLLPGAATPTSPAAAAHTPQPAAAPEKPLEPVDQSIRQQLVECLPSACPTALKLQFVVTRLLTEGAARLAASSAHASAATATSAALLPSLAQKIATRFSDTLGAEVAAAQAALLQRDTEGVARFAAAPPLVRDAAQGGVGLRASLARQLATLQDEAARWEALRSTYSRAPGAASDAQGPGEAGVHQGAAGSQGAGVVGAAVGGAQRAGDAAAAVADAAPDGEVVVVPDSQPHVVAGGGEGVQLGTQGGHAPPVHIASAGGPAAAAGAAAGSGRDDGAPSAPAGAAAAAAEMPAVGAQHQGAGEAAADAAGAAAAAVAAGAPAATSLLAGVRASTAVRMAAQVEAVCGVLSRVELLVGRAERVCSSMQAEFHADKFRTFPHVNSPAWLIKSIAAGAAAGGLGGSNGSLGAAGADVNVQPPRF